MRYDVHYIRDSRGNVIREEIRSRHPFLRMLGIMALAYFLSAGMSISFELALFLIAICAVAWHVIPLAIDLYQEWREDVSH